MVILSKSNRKTWGAYVGSAHLDTSFGPQLIGALLFSSWAYAVGCSIIALEPCGFPVTLVILKTCSGLLQSPWASLHIPLPGGPHLYALWGQQVTSPTSGGPGWALTSQSPILTPLTGGWVVTQMVPWVGSIPWRKTWQPTSVFFPGESPRPEEPSSPHSSLAVNL